MNDQQLAGILPRFPRSASSARLRSVISRTTASTRVFTADAGTFQRNFRPASFSINLPD